jgi:hypothetical protein
MTDAWYEIVDADTRLTQGDLIFDCPLVSWDPASVTPAENAGQTSRTLQDAVRAIAADVVVMTQACDLEHEKVGNVVLCPHLPVAAYRALWEETLRKSAHNPSEKAWRKTCDDIANGYVWNQSFLNSFSTREMSSEIRVVEFREVFTVPRAFIESLLRARKTPRLRLLPPYREHLSQAFARFFMRVGLPQPIDKTW